MHFNIVFSITLSSQHHSNNTRTRTATRLLARARWWPRLLLDALRVQLPASRAAPPPQAGCHTPLARVPHAPTRWNVAVQRSAAEHALRPQASGLAGGRLLRWHDGVPAAASALITPRRNLREERNGGCCVTSSLRLSRAYLGK